jgi:1-aminocyclopropane-1-carboxylate deaminase/D-cysteine desulfhydrase-like pyridoxal-dependent ACC family enzyme
MLRTQVPQAAIGRDELLRRIDSLPRVELATLPTPLDRCPRLSEALAGPTIFMKRDDLTGLAFGGNKTRHLEFVFADVLAKGADTVVAGAYTQSNWCRQITAAARRHGLAVELILLHGLKGPRVQGNLLLDRLMGANVTVVDVDDMQRIQPLLDEKARAVADAGGRPYVIAPFSLEQQVRSAASYVIAALELDVQCDEAGIDPDWVYIAGANMTPAGLIAGLRMLGRRARLVSVSPIRWDEDRATDILRIARAVAAKLDVDVSLSEDDLIVEDDYIGESYGIVTPEGRSALRLVAESEGILLDPVYSSKAMAALAGHVREGRISQNETVLFVHTGGTPALFAYAEDLIDG